VQTPSILPRKYSIFFWLLQVFVLKKVKIFRFISIIDVFLGNNDYIRADLCAHILMTNDKLIKNIIEGLQDGKARNIQVIDMRKLEEAAFHYFVVCEGTSSTHVYGIADGLMRSIQKQLGQRQLGTVGMGNRQWIAIDYGYVLVHVFQPETREFYNLESLWEDAAITKIPDLD